MKRLMSFVLICVLCLTSCNTRMYKEQSVVVRDAHSDVGDISIEIKGLHVYSDFTALAVVWKNDTKYALTYGESYIIERMEEGEWVDCSLRTNVHILIGYTLEPNDSVEKDYRLTDAYDISKPGLYRFRSGCSVEMPVAKECSVWAEFLVE